MSFAKMIFALLFFIIGSLIGITEIYILINPNELQMVSNFNAQHLWLVHATYLLCTISCLGSSFLLAKDSDQKDDEIDLK